MKKLYFILAMLFLGGLFFNACEEDEGDDGGGGTVTEKKCYLTKMYNDGTLSTEIIWNAENQLTRVNEYDSAGTNDFYMEMTWTDGNVTKIEWFGLDEKSATSSKWAHKSPLKLTKTGVKTFSSEMYSTYTYTDGKLARSDDYEYDSVGNVVDVGYYTYEYTGANITKASFIYYDFSEEFDLMYNDYTYDADGNLTEYGWYVNEDTKGFVLASKYTYTYDDKKSIYSNTELPMMEAFLVSPNNILTETDVEYVWDPGTYEYTHTYTYNDDNYPITEVFTDVDYGESYNSSYEYNCSE